MKEIRRESDRLFMWAGGKQKMLPHLAPLLPESGSYVCYVEPFAGGAAVFNHLSRQVQISAKLCDINGELMGLYRMVRDDPEDLIARMQALEEEWTPKSIAERKELYYRLRQEYWALPPGDEATALLYFLMRTGFNGIWQTCKASGGRYGTPVGLANRKRVMDPDVVRLWSARLARTEIISGTYADLSIDPGSFVFCDPPYRNSFTTYGTDFGDGDQVQLISWCRRMHEKTGSIVWLCNRDSGDGFFERHAPEATIHRFPVTYTAGRRKRTDEGYSATKAVEVLLVWN